MPPGISARKNKELSTIDRVAKHPEIHEMKNGDV